MNTADISFELDHIGIAVESVEKGYEFYQALGLKTPHIETVESEKVTTGTLWLGNKCSLELLEPTASDSTIAKYLAKRGPGIHHICLRVKNLDEIVKGLKGNGVRLINEEPKMGANNCRFVFVHPQSTGGVLLELSEKI